MSSIQVHTNPTSDLKPSNTSVQYIDVANSSTMDVVARVQVSGGPYHAMLNEHDTGPELNGSSKDLARLPSHATSVNEVNDALGTNIFASLSHKAILPKAHDIEVMWFNMATTLQKDLGEPRTFVPSSKFSNLPVVQRTYYPDSQPKATAEWQSQRAAQPPRSVGGRTPSTHVDDYADGYPWPLGEGLHKIQQQLKSNSLFNFSSPIRPDHPKLITPAAPKPKSGIHGRQTTNLSKESSISSSDSLPSLYASTTNQIKPTRTLTGIKGVDKTIFTPPSPVPSTINNDYFRHTSNTPDWRRTPSTAATCPPPSPVIMDHTSYLTWSEEGIFQGETAAHSPATSTPASPGVTDGDHSRSEEVNLRGKEPEYRTAELLFEDDDESSLFGDTSISAVDYFERQSEEELPIPSITKSIRPPGANAVITRRPVEELKALRPRQKKKPTQGKRAYQFKPKEVQDKVRHITRPVFLAPIPEQTVSRRGVKRPASPSFAQPTKRRATQAHSVRSKAVPPIPSRSKLVDWTSRLSSLEEIVYKGKQGTVDLKRLRALLGELVAKVEVIPAAWVLEEVRTRAVKGVEERKNKHQMLEYVASGYLAIDGEGTWEENAVLLLDTWASVNNQSCMAGTQCRPLLLYICSIHCCRARWMGVRSRGW
ncbi:hypothetical protein C8R44DRAFT_784377 [Mycena epipterygia]|nr:hypothetical protein C8R44DRAFT_784377 [Mycena epipterygia]